MDKQKMVLAATRSLHDFIRENMHFMRIYKDVPAIASSRMTTWRRRSGQVRR
jgi:hypothetical protein